MAESKITYQPQYACRLGNSIDLTPYNGVNGNFYTCPYDGIVVLESQAGTGYQCYCLDGWSNSVIAVARSNGTLNGFASLNVRKGQALAVDGTNIHSAVYKGYEG